MALKVLLSFALALTISTEWASSKAILGGGMPQDMVELGEVDGKIFYAELGTWLDWYSASFHCQDYGLRLATINSTDQAALLVDGLQDIFKIDYWTAARESRGQEMFVWEGTNGTKPRDGIFSSWSDAPVRDEAYHYCGAFTIVNPPHDMRPMMSSMKCSRALVGALCEKDAQK